MNNLLITFNLKQDRKEDNELMFLTESKQLIENIFLDNTWQLFYFKRIH
jgi:hypothetical protein